MPVITTYDPKTSITCHKLQGAGELEEMIATVKRRYESGDGYLRVMWDMREADMTNLQPDTVRKFMAIAARYAAGIPETRIAVVASGDLQFGFARLSSAYADMEGAAEQYAAFRTVKDATEWLIGASSKTNDAAG
ncbi:MAG: hypothetical protein ACFHX7_08520 [Pseudomonadota bacterium]